MIRQWILDHISNNNGVFTADTLSYEHFQELLDNDPLADSVSAHVFNRELEILTVEGKVVPLGERDVSGYLYHRKV